VTKMAWVALFCTNRPNSEHVTLPRPDGHLNAAGFLPTTGKHTQKETVMHPN